MSQQVLPVVTAQTQPVVLRRPWLVLGFLIVCSTLAAFGNAWDLYWHIMVGRDSFWIPPHTMMYTAVALSGILVASVVVITTLQRPTATNTVNFFGFRGPLGLIVLGLGALQMVLSAPFDDWWHRVYGLDVTVWSPPHLIGFSGAVVMLSGVIIAVLSESRRSQIVPRLAFWLVAFLFALVVRWITFLNSSSLTLSWVLERDEYAIVEPWIAWWGLWASFAMAWIWSASSRCWSERRTWQLPLAVLLLAIVLRGLEWVVSAIGFAMVLPWGDQNLRRPFYPLLGYDFGLWVTTLVLLLPAFGQALLAWRGKDWSALRFGLSSGVMWGSLLSLQFIVLRIVLDFEMVSLAANLTMIAICLLTGVIGGLLGAYQGNWLRRFER